MGSMREGKGELSRQSFEWKPILFALLLTPFFAEASKPSQRLVARIRGYFSSPYGYLEYLPENYNHSTRYPLVIYLHGIKETGAGLSETELEKVARNGVPLVIRKYERSFPFIMIAPQSPGLHEDGFDAKRVEKLIQIITENYSVDPERIYVTGVSYGAFAAWRLASYIPDKLAAVVPFSSCGGDYDITKLKQVPVWAFANAGDKQEVPECMQDLIARIRKIGGTPLLTLHPKKGHNAWERTYKAQYMWDWLLAQKLNTSENHSPHLINPGSKILAVGAEAKYSLMVSDRDNDSITFHIDGPLAKGSRFNIISNGYAELILNSLRPGLFNVSVSVSDGKGGFSRQQFFLRTSFELLFNSYILLLICQPFIIGLPLCTLFIFLVLMERLINNCFVFITRFFYWLVILILILPALSLV